MSFSQYVKGGVPDERASGGGGAHFAGLQRQAGHDDSQSGSYGLSSFLTSSTKHVRRLGTVKTKQAPRRFQMTPLSSTGSTAGTVTHIRPRQDENQPKPTAMRALPMSTPSPAKERSRPTSRDDQSIHPARISEGEPSPELRRSHSQPPAILVTNRGFPSAPERSCEKEGKNVIRVNDNSYTVLSVIGKGGSSVVYEVLDGGNNLRAIKMVDLSDVEEAQARGYLNEVYMLEKLQGNPKIITMFEYEYRKDEDLLFVVMERGETDLATLLRKISSITAVQRRFYWSEMLEAVKVIHNANIIHSDLKPANFLSVRGELKLIDFGIASSMHGDKTSVIKDSQMGTFNFMSPEAIQDQSMGNEEKPRIKISKKTDIWSLGCILYNMTYGKMPFGDIKLPIRKVEAIINPAHQIPFPEKNHDPLLIDVIKKCLIRDPQQRASIEDLLSHPYLSTDQVLHKLYDVLTPNTKKKISGAVQKLTQSQPNQKPF